MRWLGVWVRNRGEGSRRIGEVLDLVAITVAALIRTEAAALSERNGEVDRGWLAGLLSGAKGTFLGQRAVGGLADGVVLQALVRDDGLGRQAADVEPLVEGLDGLVHVGLREAEGLASETDLVDKVADFEGAEPHELVDLVD